MKKEELYLKKSNHFKMRLSTPELEEMKKQADMRGFKSIASFLRHMALERNIMIEQRIIETNRIVRELKEMMHQEEFD